MHIDLHVLHAVTSLTRPGPHCEGQSIPIESVRFKEFRGLKGINKFRANWFDCFWDSMPLKSGPGARSCPSGKPQPPRCLSSSANGKTKRAGFFTKGGRQYPDISSPQSVEREGKPLPSGTTVLRMDLFKQCVSFWGTQKEKGSIHLSVFAVCSNSYNWLPLYLCK